MFLFSNSKRGQRYQKGSSIAGDGKDARNEVQIQIYNGFGMGVTQGGLVGRLQKVRVSGSPGASERLWWWCLCCWRRRSLAGVLVLAGVFSGGWRLPPFHIPSPPIAHPNPSFLSNPSQPFFLLPPALFCYLSSHHQLHVTSLFLLLPDPPLPIPPLLPHWLDSLRQPRVEMFTFCALGA